jgi:hypothetical protein
MGDPHKVSPGQSQPGNEKSARGGAHDVIVVGAGISGCACAAWLATRGRRVLVISSALDSVGLPSYGPVLAVSRDECARLAKVLRLLPADFNQALVGFAWADPVTDTVVIDRRVVSVEMKRRLELLDGLTFRQGLVVNVRCMDDQRAVADPAQSVDDPGEPADARSSLEVETAFGETFCARAVVLAVGLGLHGRIRISEHEIAGGRYGEVPADRLYESLLRAGAEFELRGIRVGARVQANAERAKFPARERSLIRLSDLREDARCVLYRGRSSGPSWGIVELAGIPGNENVDKEALAFDKSPSSSSWPPGFPPAPHTSGALVDRTIFWARADGSAIDGLATHEFYLSPETESAAALGTEDGDGGGALAPALEDQAGALDLCATRPAHTIRARVLRELCVGGRLPSVPGIWACGRASGAASYIEELETGVATADAINGSAELAGCPARAVFDGRIEGRKAAMRGAEQCHEPTS